jgi:uncharacterized protein YjiS (DUF1127 family)
VGRLRLIAVALVAAGCGATPPQAPGPDAYRLNKALSSVSTACGHAYEIRTFSKGARALAGTERQADKQIPVLARIYRRNPNWVFQGKTVAELVQLSRTYLDDCGLHRAARRLRGATSAR